MSYNVNVMGSREKARVNLDTELGSNEKVDVRLRGHFIHDNLSMSFGLNNG